jgi:hypothetical protein
MMAMNKKLAASTLFVLLLICASLVGSAFAQTSVVVGVSQGDSFKYDITYLWSSTNHADVVPYSLILNNQTDYFQVKVDAEVGNALRLSTILRLLNGTEIPGSDIAEVGNTTSLRSLYFYAANITSGDYLFPLATDLPFKINSTIFRTYANNEFRPTNHIEVNRTDLTDKIYSSMDLYFDKQTGVVVEATLKEVYTDLPRETYITKITLTESSLWVISDVPTTSTSSSSLTTPAPTQTTNPAITQGSQNSTSSDLDTLLIVLVIVFVIILFVMLKRSPKKDKKPRPTKTAAAQTPPLTPVASGMVRCSKCGYDNPEANEFCGKCRARLHK